MFRVFRGQDFRVNSHTTQVKKKKTKKKFSCVFSPTIICALFSARSSISILTSVKNISEAHSATFILRYAKISWVFIYLIIAYSK